MKFRLNGIAYETPEPETPVRHREEVARQLHRIKAKAKRRRREARRTRPCPGCGAEARHDNGATYCAKCGEVRVVREEEET